MQVLMAQLTGVGLHARFSFSCVEGNIVKNLLIIGVKLNYSELRMMKFFWEFYELERHLSQTWDSWEGSYEQWHNEVLNMRVSFESARSRLGQKVAEIKEEFKKAVGTAVDDQLRVINRFASSQSWDDKDQFPYELGSYMLSDDDKDAEMKGTIIRVVEQLNKLKAVPDWWKAQKLEVPEQVHKAA